MNVVFGSSCCFVRGRPNSTLRITKTSYTDTPLPFQLWEVCNVGPGNAYFKISSQIQREKFGFCCCYCLEAWNFLISQTASVPLMYVGYLHVRLRSLQSNFCVITHTCSDQVNNCFRGTFQLLFLACGFLL